MNGEVIERAIQTITAQPSISTTHLDSLNTALSLFPDKKVEAIAGCGWWRDILDLGLSQAHVLAQDIGQLTEYLAIINTVFGGNQLDQLLNSIAPYEHHVSPHGVIADWKALDDPEAITLMKAHQHALGKKAWDRFAANQPLWTEVLSYDNDKYLKRYLDLYPTYAQARQSLSSDMAKGQIIWSHPAYGTISKATLAQIPALVAFENEWMSFLATQAEFREKSEKERRQLAVSFLETHSNSDNIYHDYSVYCQHTLIPKIRQGEIVLAHFPDGLSVTYIKEEDQEMLDLRLSGNALASAVQSWNPYNRLHWRVDSTSIIDADTMFPILHWQRDNETGEREWLLDFVDESDSDISKLSLQILAFIEKELQACDLDPSGNDHRIRFAQRANPLLGLAVLAQAEPEIRNEWPAEEGFSRDGFKQKIGRAQVPIKLLTEEELIDSSLILALENTV